MNLRIGLRDTEDYLEIDRNIHVTSTAATNEPPGPTRGCVLSGGEVRRSKRVDDLFNTWTIERNLLVIGIAEMGERELVVTTLIRLESDLATRTSNGFDQLARGFIVLLGSVINLEGTSTTENERSRDAGITRTSEKLSMIHIGLQNHSPLVDLLPLNFRAGEGHLDDLARFRAQHVAVTIIALDTKDGIFTRGTCM